MTTKQELRARRREAEDELAVARRIGRDELVEIVKSWPPGSVVEIAAVYDLDVKVALGDGPLVAARREKIEKLYHLVNVLHAAERGLEALESGKVGAKAPAPPGRPSPPGAVGATKKPWKLPRAAAPGPPENLPRAAKGIVAGVDPRKGDEE